MSKNSRVLGFPMDKPQIFCLSYFSIMNILRKISKFTYKHAYILSPVQEYQGQQKEYCSFPILFLGKAVFFCLIEENYITVVLF